MKSITPKELIKSSDKSVLILDIRHSDSFKDWSIKDSINVDVYDDIWNGNFGDVKQKLCQLPKDKKIVTVCNAGVTSQNASMLLESMGYNTLVLEKGMMGWNALHQAVDVANENDLLLKQIIRVGKGCLSYMIGSNSTKECFIVDPSQFVEEYLEIAKENGLRIIGIIETHVHADHLSGAMALKEFTKTEYYVSGTDLKAKADFLDLDTLDELKIGDNSIKIIKTPGHTDGSVCLLVNDKALLTGDTLFLEGVGRPDLGRNKEDIEKGAKILFSALNRVKELGNKLIILPAHFTSCAKVPICEKLGNLLYNNLTLKISSEQEFVSYILNNLPMMPPNYGQIKSINSGLMRLPRQMGEQLEFGPNRCASR
ncbi:MBL fold metallo-hydrolase [Candidatus Woesearchaeota archaeon]|nr:MBL fold metallo-hydrolase [Candidatus Woesearchaeota archaeon]